MLKKYLQFLIGSFDKLTSLGGSDSTWIDYFLTVGSEILVILIGLAYVAAIFLIVYIPIFGNKKVIKGIRKRDKWCRFNALYKKYISAFLEVRSIISRLRINDYTYNDRTDEELHETLNKFGINFTGSLCKDNKFDKKLLDDMLSQYHFDKRIYIESLSKFKWDNCGIFTEFNILSSSAKKEIRYYGKCIVACAGLLLTYAVFVIPLILMLFK